MSVLLSACSSVDGVSTVNHTMCSAGQALGTEAVSGTTLSARQIALTFDDGPATRTAELSAYLKAQAVPAGFFVNGKNVAGHPGVLAKLVADGHVIGNHSHDHLDLTDRAAFPETTAGGTKLVAQLASTDSLIGPFVKDGHFLFRAPFGAFDARNRSVLQASAMKKYVGHVGWDMGSDRTATTAADWACWQDEPKLTTKACGDLYLAEIVKVGRGIVLLHDADYGNVTNHSTTSGVGNTADMVKYLVPLLKARGFTFVRVDAVPAIATAIARGPDAPDLPASAGSGADATGAGGSPAARPDPCAQR